MEISTYTDILARNTGDSFYKKLLFQIPDFVFQMKVSVVGNYTFPFVSRSAYNAFNLVDAKDIDDVVGIIKSIIIPEYWHSFFETIETCRVTIQPWAHEFQVLMPSGRRWMRGLATVERSVNGEVNFYGRVIDFTEVKEQEDRLRLSEQRIQFALEASTKGIWDVDLVLDKVFYSSQSMKMLQFGDTEIIDSHNRWDDRIHPDDLQDYKEEIQRHLDSLTPYYENAKRMIALDGTCKWILSRGKVIERDENGKAVRLVGTHTDITVQKEREQQLTNTLEIISEQNSRLLNFAHIVSHNLRSHSGNFSTLLQIIEEEDDEEVKNESFEHLKSTSDALNETIEHLKDLVNIHTGLHHKTENLDLNEYLKKVLLILREDIVANKVTIINDIPTSALVPFNAAYLESILLNFTTNAIKYSSPDRSPIITYSYEEYGKSKVLLIKDNGLGINLEKYGARLFGMYNTFHSNPAARGIGLFITKNQIESMGGSVEIESTEGFGTTFKINFNEKI